MVEEAIYVYTITQRGTPSGDDDIVHGCPVTVLRITPSDPYLDKSKTIDMDQREYFFFCLLFVGDLYRLWILKYTHGI